ncbi:nphp3 [Symbiodinium natans]|uniref:Nphp3 protein n=1 Tax=Symbiodinium natans TaxID=878477 RepID=A0A812SDQ8_9DINO|nr:nphp3 [Symbiodinium natans]
MDSMREEAAAEVAALAANQKGWKHLCESKHLEAIELFSRSIQLDPCLAEAYNNRGIALEISGASPDQDYEVADALSLHDPQRMDRLHLTRQWKPIGWKARGDAEAATRAEDADFFVEICSVDWVETNRRLHMLNKGEVKFGQEYRPITFCTDRSLGMGLCVVDGEAVGRSNPKYSDIGQSRHPGEFPRWFVATQKEVEKVKFGLLIVQLSKAYFRSKACRWTFGYLRRPELVHLLVCGARGPEIVPWCSLVDDVDLCLNAFQFTNPSPETMAMDAAKEDKTRLAIQLVDLAADDIGNQEHQAWCELPLRDLSYALALKLGEETDAALEAAERLVRVCGDTGQSQRAQHLGIRLLELTEPRFGAESMESARALMTLAQQLSDAEKRIEAQERARKVFEQNLGPDHPAVARTLAALAKSYGLLSDHGKQLQLLERALHIYRNSSGSDSVECGSVLSNYGNALMHVGRYMEAREAQERSVCIMQTEFGEEHPNIGIVLTNLGSILCRLGDPEGALEILPKALRIKEMQYGFDHPEMANTLASLANAYEQLGNRAEAQELVERVLHIQERVDGGPRKFLNQQRQKLEGWQHTGKSPLLVVRLCFVGKGRAGKTSTLKRLKGEIPHEGEEDSTYGVEVWAGQAQEQLDSSWQDCCNKSIFAACAARAFKTDRHQPEQQVTVQTAQPQVQQPHPAAPLATQRAQEPKPQQKAHSQAKQQVAQGATVAAGAGARIWNSIGSMKAWSVSDLTDDQKVHKLLPKPGLEETLGMRLMDDEWVLQIGRPGDEGGSWRPRLQCWDFPGQEDYSQCNLLYFHGRGIYLVFCDVSRDLEVAWQDLQFWLWAVAHYAVDHDEAQRAAAAPPVMIVCTKWESKRFNEQELDGRIDGLLEKVPRLKDQLQEGPIHGVDACRSKWIFPVENFAKRTLTEDYIKPLRQRLHQLTAELVLPGSGTENVKHAGLQSKHYPVAWLRAHDLLTDFAGGFEVEASKAEFLAATAGSNLVLKHELAVRQVQGGETIKVPRGIHCRLLSPLHERGFVSKQEEEVQALQPAVWMPEHQDEGDSGFTGNADIIRVRIAPCTLLELSQVQALLAGMKPTGIHGKEVDELLALLHSLGILIWIADHRLRGHVLLDIRKVAVALTRVISFRFFRERRFEHSREYKKQLEESAAHMKDRRRFWTDGLATRKLLEELWATDFKDLNPEERRIIMEIVLEIMLQKGLILERAFEDEFIVPCCLPDAAVPELPRGSKTLYVDMDGLMPPAILAQVVHELCQQRTLDSKLLPGPPQIFRNCAELRSTVGLVTLSLSAATSFRVLRIHLEPWDSQQIHGDEAEREMRRIISCFFGALGLDRRLGPDTVLKRQPEADSRSLLKDIAQAELERLRSQLLRQRRFSDLSDQLRKIVRSIALQSHVAPAGSFRFQNMLYPCDVDLEEYVVLVAEAAKDKESSSLVLASLLQKILRQFPRTDPGMHWEGLTAGKDPLNEKKLTWTLAELDRGEKECSTNVKLATALCHGNKVRTAFIRVYAKTTLFKEPVVPDRFFEITNVIRFGYVQDGRVKPVTQEVDLLAVVEDGLKQYSGPTPNCMKFAKRLWERSVYLAQRNIHVMSHLIMLEALQPIFVHWVAQLAQIAAHAETLKNMLDLCLEDHVVQDMPVLRQSCIEIVKRVDEECRLKEGNVQASAASEALEILGRVIRGIEDGTRGQLLKEILQEARNGLEACVELTVISWLGSFPRVTKPLSAQWDFPSDHLPIATKICCGSVAGFGCIYVASWQVLNMNLVPRIQTDEKGLDGSGITTWSAEERQKQIVTIVEEMLLPNGRRRHMILCLQGCWRQLLHDIADQVSAKGFATSYSSCHADTDDGQAIIYDETAFTLTALDADPVPFENAFRKVVLPAHFDLKKGNGKLRILTVQLPRHPPGPMHRALGGCLERLGDLADTPTLVLGDFGLPEKVIAPMLKCQHSRACHVRFAPVPYPTTVCEGSLLPKRTDNIALLSPEDVIKAEPLEANDVVFGLQKRAELLNSRSLGIADCEADDDDQANLQCAIWLSMR